MTDIIILNGKKYKLVIIDFPEYEGTVYGLKPLKEAEKKSTYFVTVFDDAANVGEYILKLDLDLTPNTAKKVADAFNKGVNYITTTGKDFEDADFTDSFMTAREAFMEEQDD